MDENLLFMPAAKAAALIRARRLSSAEYVQAVLDAIEASRPVLNAFVTVCADTALAAAREADAAVARGGSLGPLHGVPFSVKDLVATADVRTTHGSHVFADNVPTADAVCVRRMKAAGAVMIGKTTTPEFGHKGLTDSPLQGVTRNPWNPDHTPGGSSGGAAAAVAAGLAPLAIGTDGAGSIRGPAASAGIFGLKPTRGAVPFEWAADAFANNSFAGPMTRTVKDAAIMLQAMAGPDPRDPWSLGDAMAPVRPALVGQDLSGIRIGYVERMANPRLDPDVRAATEAAVAALADMGAEVETVTDEIDWIEYEGRVLYQTGIAARVAPLRERWGDRLDETLVAFADWGMQYSMLDRVGAEAARTRLYQAVQKLFERYDFLVSPTTARTALRADFRATEQVIVDNQPCGITRQSWTAYQYPFNLTGHPAASLPNGWAADGLPMALQVVGRWWADMDVLRLAALFEEARPWADRRPPSTGRG